MRALVAIMVSGFFGALALDAATQAGKAWAYQLLAASVVWGLVAGLAALVCLKALRVLVDRWNATAKRPRPRPSSPKSESSEWEELVVWVWRLTDQNPQAAKRLMAFWEEADRRSHPIH